MVFKEVGNELPEIWNPEKKGDFIVGVFKHKKENVGKHKSNLYVLDQGKELISFWGSTVLDDKMACYVNIGDEIRVTYQGENKDPKYQKFMIEKDIDEKTSEETSEKTETSEQEDY